MASAACGTHRDFERRMHRILWIASILFTIGAAIVLVTLSVRKDARWRGVVTLVTWLAIGVVIGTVLFPVMAPGGGGLAQRASFAVGFAWMIVVAHEMPKIAIVVPGYAVRA